MRAPPRRPLDRRFPRSARRDVRPGSGGQVGPLVFAAGIAGIIALGVVVARPALLAAVTDLAEERPGLLRNAAVRELVRSSLADAAERPADSGAASRTFVVEKGDTAATVAERLADRRVVSRQIVFLLALYDTGKEESLQAGTYRVSAAMKPAELAELFQRAFGEQLVLRVIEGWRLGETAAEVEKRFPRVRAQEFLKAATAGPYRYDFLRDVRPGTPLEGFLYPDTYFFFPDVTVDEIVRTLLDTFERRAGDVVTKAALRRDVRVYDIVVIASIVEREAKARKESPVIASVYWNRVARGMALDADPTVQYAIGAWRELTLDDLKVDSPYNTYRNAGLPPTPISSAGQDALEASADPAKTDFLFFVAKNDGTGEHAFARTIEEHEANRRKYGNR